jgi:hypothetical protein
MLNTIEAVIDKQGRVSLKEKVNLEKTRRALVTILDDETPAAESVSLVGSIEIVDEDLEAGSREISNLFHQSLDKNGLNP